MKFGLGIATAAAFVVAAPASAAVVTTVVEISGTVSSGTVILDENLIPRVTTVRFDGQPIRVNFGVTSGLEVSELFDRGVTGFLGVQLGGPSNPDGRFNIGFGDFLDSGLRYITSGQPVVRAGADGTLTVRFDGVTCCIQNNAASLFLSGRKSEDGTLTLWSGQFGANRYDNDATEIYTYDLNFTGSSAGADFDRLALQADAVPEPATWAMMIGGFGLAGAAVRRRSRRTGMGVAV